MGTRCIEAEAWSLKGAGAAARCDTCRVSRLECSGWSCLSRGPRGEETGNQTNLRCNQGRRAGPPVGEVWGGGGGGVPGFEPRRPQAPSGTSFEVGCCQGERQGARVTARGPPAEASWGPGAEAPSLLENKPVAEDLQAEQRDSGREGSPPRGLPGGPAVRPRAFAAGRAGSTPDRGPKILA